MISKKIFFVVALLASFIAHAVPGLTIPERPTFSRTDLGVDLMWEPIEGTQRYDVYRDGQPIGSSTEPFFSDLQAPAADTSYFVTACPIDSFDCSDASESVTVLSASGGGLGPNDCAVLPITVPMNVGFTLNDSGGATLFWDPIPGATGYLIHTGFPGAIPDFLDYAGTAIEFEVDVFDVELEYTVSIHIGDNHDFGRSNPATEGATSGGNELADAIARADAAEADFSTCAIARAGLEDELIEAQARIEALENDTSADPTVAELQAQIAELEADLDAALELAQDQQDRIDEQAADIEAQQVQAADDAATIATLQSELAACQAGSSDSEAVAALELQVTTLEAEAAAAAINFVALTTDRDNQIAVSQDLAIQVSDLQAFIDENCPIDQVAQ